MAAPHSMIYHIKFNVLTCFGGIDRHQNDSPETGRYCEKEKSVGLSVYDIIALWSEIFHSRYGSTAQHDIIVSLESTDLILVQSLHKAVAIVFLQSYLAILEHQRLPRCHRIGSVVLVYCLKRKEEWWVKCTI